MPLASSRCALSLFCLPSLSTSTSTSKKQLQKKEKPSRILRTKSLQKILGTPNDSKNPRRTQRPPESKKTVTLATSAPKPTKETAPAAVETVASVAPMVAPAPTDQQLQALYMQRPEVLQNGRAAEKNKTLEPVMEHFINAKTRSHLLCFRKPPRIYFGNLLIGECRCERHRSCGLTIT